MRHLSAGAIIGFFLLCSSPGFAQIEYTLTDLGSVSATGINDSGQVVGYSYSGGYSFNPFVWSQQNGFQTLGPLPAGAQGVVPSAINDNGEICGTIENSVIPITWSSTTGYNALQGGGSANAINLEGDVVGNDGGFAMEWPSNGPEINLDGYGSDPSSVNNAGDVAITEDSTGFYGQDFQNATIELKNGQKIGIAGFGGNETSVNAINNFDEAVGASNYTFGGPAIAYISNGPATSSLGTLGGSSSHATDIDDSSQVVGYSQTVNGDTHGFVIIAGKMNDLNTLAPTATASGLTITSANAINNLGKILGMASTSGGQTHAVVLTPYLVTTPTTTPAPAPFGAPPSTSLGQLEVFDKATDEFDLNPNNGNFINPNEPTVVITHGFNDKASTWASFATELESTVQNPVNIVAWNWSSAAAGSLAQLPWIAGATPVQGDALAVALSSALGGAEYDEPIHFIGHSLGTLVNAEAINKFRVYDPSDLQIQDTLFDDAEIGAGYTVSAIPSVPVAWIDNYISAFGNLHSTAANIILTGGPGVAEPVAFHSYPQEWYEQSMGVNFNPWVGPQADITQGGINGNQPTGGSYFIQNGDNLTSVVGGFPAAQADLLTRDEIEAYTIIPSYLKSLQATDITAPVQTFNNVQAEIVPTTSPTGAVLAGIEITLTKESNPILETASRNVQHTAAEISIGTSANDSAFTSSSYALVTFTIPTNAQYLSLMFLCDDLSADDVFTVGINDTPIFQAENQFVSNGSATSTGFIDVSQWSGQNVQLFLGLNASDDDNLGGTITVEDIEFASVPEPASLSALGIATLLIGMRRRFE